MASEKTSIEFLDDNQIAIRKENIILTREDTGDQYIVNEIAKFTHGQKHFWKLYLMDFLSVLGIFDSRQLDVFIYICENTKSSDNMFWGTYDKIQKDTGVSRDTVARIMKKLQKFEFITRKAPGVYMINPKLLMKGNVKKQHLLISHYLAEEPLNTTKALPERPINEVPEPMGENEQLTLDDVVKKPKGYEDVK